MRIKAIYKKNLKMNEGKVASQIAHAVKNLGITPTDSDIIVLRVSDKKFDELVVEHPDCYVQVDKGLTVVEKGTATAAAWIVKEEPINIDIGKSICCNFETIPPDWKMAEKMGSLYAAYACHICKKCGNACEISE